MRYGYDHSSTCPFGRGRKKETWNGTHRAVLAKQVSMMARKNAVQKYAEDAAVSDVLLICDETFFESGKKGYLFTSEALYATYLKKQEKIPFDDLKEVKLDDKKSVCTFSFEDGSEKSAFSMSLRRILPIF